MAPAMNEFFDIGRMPKGMGLLRFGISLSNIQTTQLPERCFEYIEIFGQKNDSQRTDNGIWLHFTYTDFLYLYNEATTSDIKNKYMNLEIDHKNGILKVLKQDKKYSSGFFSFGVWNQLYLDVKGWIHFSEFLRELRRIYDKDPLFQKYMLEDAQLYNKELDENQIMFFLEEHLMMHLIGKWIISFPQNDYIKDRQDWILICYPGPFMKHHVYILQKNFFNLENSKNEYEDCFYNLKKKILYNASRIDLETYDYE